MPCLPVSWLDVRPLLVALCILPCSPIYLQLPVMTHHHTSSHIITHRHTSSHITTHHHTSSHITPYHHPSPHITIHHRPSLCNSCSFSVYVALSRPPIYLCAICDSLSPTSEVVALFHPSILPPTHLHSLPPSNSHSHSPAYSLSSPHQRPLFLLSHPLPLYPTLTSQTLTSASSPHTSLPSTASYCLCPVPSLLTPRSVVHSFCPISPFPYLFPIFSRFPHLVVVAPSLGTGTLI